MEKEDETRRKAEADLQTYSHGRCDTSFSLQVSDPHGTSC